MEITSEDGTVKINKPLLRKLAQLAQLEVDAHDEAVLLEDLNKIVTWIEKLRELDTTGIDPLGYHGACA